MTSRIVHVVGNGESRHSVNINDLDDFKIGCNACHRDMGLDVLVAVDQRMVKEALDRGIKYDIYTKKEWIEGFRDHLNVKQVPDLPYAGDRRQDDPWHWGSGSHAANLAGSMKLQEIHLWGFDLYGKNGLINNIYKDTKNYESSNHHSVDPSYWIYQLARCFEYYPDSQWIQHQTKDWQVPKEWQEFSNFSIEFL